MSHLPDTKNKLIMNKLIISFKKGIPSALTLLNLISGCLAVLFSFHDIALAGVMVILAGVFDFVDGLAARILDAYSDFGKELDSLADIVSFGVAPSFILFHLISTALLKGTPYLSIDLVTVSEALILAVSFLPVIFAAIRLAKFNVASNEEEGFRGLPSPAAGIFIASAGYILFTTGSLWIQDLLLNFRALVIMGTGLSILMVLPVPMFNLKFSNFSFTGNKIRYLFLLPSFILFVYLGITAIPVIITWYILLSLILVLLPRRVIE